MWRYYLQKVLYSVKAGRLFLFLCDYVHINIYVNSLKLTNVTHFPFKVVAMATGMVVAKSSSVLVVCRQF